MVFGKFNRLFLLDKFALKEYATNVIAMSTNPRQPTTYRKENAKAKRIILNGVKDHIATHIAEKDTTKEMWDTIVNLYQNPTKNRKMILKEKMRDIKM